MIQKSNRRKSRVNRGQLLNPNDPRWDIQIGIPVSRLVQILVCSRDSTSIEQARKGGVK